MTHAPARFARHVAAFVACVGLAGCAGLSMSDSSAQCPESARSPTGQLLTPQAAMAMIDIGKSTKDDVSSALGRAIVIAFDSGYEVWVYRWAGPDGTTRAATELVVLFEPLGLVTKVRVRPGYTTLNL